MEQPLREILRVELMYDDGTNNMVFLDAFHIDTQELLELKEEGLARILQRANVLLAGHKVLRLSYKDDEADWCTFNKASLRDALIFASLTQVNDCGVLPLRVTTDWTPPASAASCEGKDDNLGPHVLPASPTAQNVPACSGAVGSAQSAWVVRCDGCGTMPMEWPRFRCLDLPDYDLCSSCYSKTLLQPAAGLRFVQMDGPAECVREPPKPNTEEVERDLESQLISGEGGHDEKSQSVQPLVEIAEESRAIEELEAQKAQLPEKRAVYAAELKATIERELSEVYPILESARQAIGNLKKPALQSALAFVNPSEPLRLAFEAAVLMVKPEFGMPPPWSAVRKAMRDDKFLPSIIDFDAGTLKDSVCEFIRRRYLAHPKWDQDLMHKVSTTAPVFWLFVRSQMEFASVLQRLEPLRQELMRLEQQADEDAKMGDSEAHEGEPVDLENPLLPVTATPSPDLEATSEVSLREAMAQLLAHADPAIRSAAVKALCDAKEREADATITTDTLASTSDHVSESVGTTSTTESLSSTSAMSARVVSASPLVLGIEAEESDGSRGDVTEQKPDLAASEGARQIFRMGRILVPIGNDIPAVPACAKLVLVNDGAVPWPGTAAVAHRSGDDMDFRSMQLGCIEPGSGCEVSMELLVPPSSEPKTAFSTWAVLDEASGTGLGPVLLFEVEWTEQLAT